MSTTVPVTLSYTLPSASPAAPCSLPTSSSASCLSLPTSLCSTNHCLSLSLSFSPISFYLSLSFSLCLSLTLLFVFLNIFRLFLCYPCYLPLCTSVYFSIPFSFCPPQILLPPFPFLESPILTLSSSRNPASHPISPDLSLLSASSFTYRALSLDLLRSFHLQYSIPYLSLSLSPLSIILPFFTPIIVYSSSSFFHSLPSFRADRQLANSRTFVKCF